MFAKDYRKLAWDRLSGNWGTMILSYLIYSVIISALSSFTGIGGLILGGPLYVGFIAVVLTLVRTGTTKLDLMFENFSSNFVTNMVTYLLHTLYVMLWSLLFVIPGIVKTYSYAMTFYILRDNPGMGANEAITRSREMMNGHKWQLFCLHFSFIGWILLSILTCGLLVFMVQPYMQTATAEFYESLKNEASLAELANAPADASGDSTESV